MKELLLHIGLPKTGSSSLQYYLAENQCELESQGLCYPTTGRSKRIAHHTIARVSRCVTPRGNRFKKLRREFKQEVSQFDRVIVSSEAFQNFGCYVGVAHFFGLPKTASFPGLRQLCPERSYRIRTFCYLREFLETACSNYAQQVQNSNLHLDLESYCARRFRVPLAFRTKFWTWFSDETHFCLFERERLRNHDIVEDFFCRAGLKMPAANTYRNTNPSISGNLLAFKLLINSRKLHTGLLYQPFSELAAEDPAFRGRFEVADQTAHRLRERFSSYNRAVRQLAGDMTMKSCADGNQLFDARTWQRDVQRFLEHPSLTYLKDDPEVRRAASDASMTRELRMTLARFSTVTI